MAHPLPTGESAVRGGSLHPRNSDRTPYSLIGVNKALVFTDKPDVAANPKLWYPTHSVHQTHFVFPQTLHQPAVKALDNDQKECTDQRTSQETDDKVEVAVAVDEASSMDSEERIKLERRRRRCPTVKVEKYLNNDGDEGEKKENGAEGSIRYLFNT